MDDDHEFALEIAVQNIEDTNESEEELDELSVMSDFTERLNDDGDTQSTGGTSYHSLPQHAHPPSVPPVSLKTVLEDEHSFMLFRRFVKDSCISRNFQFWLACEHFRKYFFESKPRLMESATAIYKKFLGSSAPLHISVMDGTKKKIQLSIQFKTGLDNNLFCQAQQEVYHQMECNELRQFLLSDSFSECILFNNETSSAYFNTLESFQPARYRGGSLHSGSDDSTSVTSFNSDSMSGTVLCAPRHTRPHLLQSPRNAHSDTEHCGHSNRANRDTSGLSSSQHSTFFSRGKSISARDFSEMLYGRLTAIEKDRANFQRRARNIAREQRKSYEEIMSLDWYDAPEAVKYVKFEDMGGAGSSGLKSGEMQSSPLLSHDQQQLPNGEGGSTSHISSMAAKEIQEALKDMEITRQVRQKRTASVISASSLSSYNCDSGVGGDSGIPSSGGGSRGGSGGGGGGSGPQPHVHAYVKNQHRLTSQLSDREHKAHLAATMLINNSTHHEDLSPRSNQYRNYPGPYSSDDSSSCFTTTSQSSSSEFFIPRKASHNLYTDSDDTRQSSRFPPGMKRMSHHKRSTHASSTQQTPRYYPPQPAPPHSQSGQLVPPSQQQTYPNTTRDVPSSTSSVHTPLQSQSSGDSILVAYTIEGYNNTMAKRMPSSQLNTLGDFKEKVFQRRGLYRFFFKTFCEDLNQEIMEEFSDDCCPLPRFKGKIIGQVEKVETNL